MSKKPGKNPKADGSRPSEITNGDPTEKNIVDILWNFLSSMKLGISLLLIMAIVSIIGTIWVPQDPATGQEDFVRFYNSIPFRLIMGLLALNLLICSVNRWKSVVSTLKGPSTDFSESFVKNLKSGTSLKLESETSIVSSKAKDILTSKGYRVFIKEDGNSVKIASDKGYFGIIGPYITHISFMIMIVAIVIKFSGLVGFEGTLAGAVGETYDLRSVSNVQGNINLEDNFSIKINDFRTVYRPDGSIKQWYSDVTVIEQNKQFDYSIYVNNPLVHKGIKFYQSSYGNQFSGRFSGPSSTDQKFTVGTQDYIQPPGTNITFIPLNFDSKTNKVTFETYNGNQLVGQQQVAINTPYKYEQTEVTFESAVNYTVLTVKKDPGVPIVGVGSILLTLGVIISFLLRQRRIWLIVTGGDKGSLLHIGGLSSKDKCGLDNDIADIAEELKSFAEDNK